MAQVELHNVSKLFPATGRAAVDGVSLSVADREFVILVGPSGCGKTTTLRMIAGLEQPTSGEIRIGGRVVNDVAPKDRDIAMVFQNYALYPHMTVYRNIAFGLIMRKFPKAEIDRRVREAAALLGIQDLLDRKPKALSGGQRQRVALGRAIVRQPQVFLFDEPLSNLDATMRVATRAEIKKLHQRLGATMVYVTHDQTEAMTMGDRIVVMNGGRVQQAGPPLELYDKPANRFVAGFIGSPAMNFIEGRLVGNGGELAFEKGSLRLPVSAPQASLLRSSLTSGRGEITLGLRPEHFALVGPAHREGDWRPLRGRVEIVEPMGAEVYVTLAIEGQALTVRLEGHAKAKAGEDLELSADMNKAQWFDPASGKSAGI